MKHQRIKASIERELEVRPRILWKIFQLLVVSAIIGPYTYWCYNTGRTGEPIHEFIFGMLFIASFIWVCGDTAGYLMSERDRIRKRALEIQIEREEEYWRNRK